MRISSMIQGAGTWCGLGLLLGGTGLLAGCGFDLPIAFGAWEVELDNSTNTTPLTLQISEDTAANLENAPSGYDAAARTFILAGRQRVSVAVDCEAEFEIVAGGTATNPAEAFSVPGDCSDGVSLAVILTGGDGAAAPGAGSGGTSPADGQPPGTWIMNLNNTASAIPLSVRVTENTVTGFAQLPNGYAPGSSIITVGARTSVSASMQCGKHFYITAGGTAGNAEDRFFSPATCSGEPYVVSLALKEPRELFVSPAFDLEGHGATQEFSYSLASAGERVFVTTSGSLGVLKLEVEDQSGNLVAEDDEHDSFGYTHNDTAAFTAPSNGTYTLRVTNLEAFVFPGMRVRAQVLPKIYRGVDAIATAFFHSCQVIDGAARCVGRNRYGRMGSGNRLGPVDDVNILMRPVYSLSTGVTDISAGADHTCAIQNGAAKCWGRAHKGQIGNGYTGPLVGTPRDVQGLSAGVTQLGAGEAHSCAVQNGAAKCWGRGDYGQLGNSATADQSTPQQVAGLEAGSTFLGVGGFHNCALHNGAVKCWGGGIKGQLGNGSSQNRSTPVQVTGLEEGVSQISSGYLHTCAVHNGAAKCWGSGFWAQLGNNNFANQNTPVQAIGLGSGITYVAASQRHTCVIHNGAAKCWGYGNNGELGDGDNSFDVFPGEVQLPENFAPVRITGGTDNKSTCALDSVGRPYCWGGSGHYPNDAYYLAPQYGGGQLGDGSVGHQQLIPVPLYDSSGL